jgi:hypothetical protein
LIRANGSFFIRHLFGTIPTVVYHEQRRPDHLRSGNLRSKENRYK